MTTARFRDMTAQYGNMNRSCGIMFATEENQIPKYLIHFAVQNVSKNISNYAYVDIYI